MKRSELTAQQKEVLQAYDDMTLAGKALLHDIIRSHGKVDAKLHSVAAVEQLNVLCDVVTRKRV